MEKIRLILLMLELVILSVEDVRHRQISVWIIGIMCVGALALKCAGVVMLQESMKDSHMIVGVLFGVGIILTAYFTRMMGVGDGCVVLLIALMTDGLQSVGLFLFAMTMASVTSMILLMTKKVKRKYEIPLIPYFLFSFIGVTLCT